VTSDRPSPAPAAEPRAADVAARGPAARPDGPAGRAPRLLSLIDTYEVSGPGRQLTAAALAHAGAGGAAKIVLLQRPGTRTPPYAVSLAAAGVDHEVVPEAGPFDPRLPGRIRRVIARFRPDVVETHSYKMTAVMWLLRRAGVVVPWVGFFHGRTRENRKVRLYHWLDEQLLPGADRIVGMSDVHRQEFARRGVRAEVVHNAVVPLAPADEPLDLSGFRVPASDTPGAPPAPLVGVIGRLSPEKGVDVFVDACAQLRAAGERFAAVIAGDGVDHQALVARVAALGLGDAVHFLGPVAAVSSFYAQVDLVVLPSRSEGLPNVLLEALHGDVPVVATRVGAVPEVLDGEPAAGPVVPPEDPAALAAAMRATWHLRGDPAARAARARVAARFSMARRMEALDTLYRAAVAARRGSTP
jgi:glycosyltransferase involved in cell wall biosynthesis